MWSVATLFVNSPDSAISFGGSYVLELFGSYLLARAFVRTPGQFRAACRGLFLILIFTIPLALYETQTGRAPLPELIAKLPGIYSVADFYNEAAGRRLGLERAQVIFVHPIHYGLFCASLISLAMVGFKGLLTPFRRHALGGLICLGVICSVSSGAILPMVLQLSLMLWGWAFERVRNRWIILSVIFTICYATVDIISNRTATEVFLEYVALSPETAAGRVVIFEWGMVNVWKHPFLGLGLNDWERPWWKFSQSMDNFWLLATVRYGIPGFILLVSAYLWLLWKVMWRDVGGSGLVWQFRRAWIFTQIGMILTLCTVDVWATTMSYTFFLFGMGAWFLDYIPRQPSSPDVIEGLPEAVARGQLLPYTRFPRRGMRGRQNQVRSIAFVQFRSDFPPVP